MKYDASDYNHLSYMLLKNYLSFDEVIDWAYAQLKNEGVDPFVEKISLCTDVREIRELIGEKYQVYGEPSNDFLVGEISTRFYKNDISLGNAINSILHKIDAKLEKTEESDLYIADDYFGWQDYPEKEAIKLAQPIFDKYRPIYEDAINKFNV